MIRKKYLNVFIVAVCAFALAACSEDEGTDPGHDGGPVVTIYSYDAPSDYDPDVTESLRIVPNGKVDKMYVYTELKADKDAFIASNGEAAYNDRVIELGQQFDGGEVQELNIENLRGLHATTVVAVAANGAKHASENLFKGIIWVDAGKAYIVENVAQLQGYVDVQRQSDNNICRVVGLYRQLDASLGSASERFVFNFEEQHGEHVCTSFETTNAPFFLVGLKDGDMLLHGYYDAANYDAYCSVAMDKDDDGAPYVQVSTLILDNNAGKLFTGGYIVMYIDEIEWLAQ